MVTFQCADLFVFLSLLLTFTSPISTNQPFKQPVPFRLLSFIGFVLLLLFFLQEIDLGYASGVKALRTSYFGDRENDWKLLVPAEVGSCMEGPLLWTADASETETSIFCTIF